MNIERAVKDGFRMNDDLGPARAVQSRNVKGVAPWVEPDYSSEDGGGMEYLKGDAATSGRPR